MKILFINPPISSNIRVEFPNHQMPLGFMYMAGILEKNGFEVKILDCPLYYRQKRKIDENTVKFGLFPEQIKEAIREFNPDIVGVSCSFSMFEADSFEVLGLVKKVNNKILTLAGGAHASSNPELILRNKNVDIVVVGEGELTVLEIAKRFRERKSLRSIKGTAVRVNKKILVNKPREYIDNLDYLEPAWHLIDFKKYFEHPDSSEVTIRNPSVTIITSRGCPGNCVFCSVHTVWGRKWRAMSAEKVVSQIEHLYKKYGVRHFRINDDNLTLDKKRVMDICNGIIEKKLDIKWDTPSGVALWTLDKEMLKIMKKSGYYRITFGIESGSKETMKYICKNIDLEKTKKLIECCHEIGLWVASFFIIGFPFEGLEDIKKTEEYITNSGINFPFVFIAQPYPGTRMYEDFKKEGLLEEGILEVSNSTITKYHTKNFSAEELNKLRTEIYRKFYLSKIKLLLNPYRFYKEFLSKIKSFEDLKYTFRITCSLVTHFLY